VLFRVPDLIVGSLRGQAGVSLALVLDWKTGAMRSDHIDEQHFYGLLAALAGGVVPPWRVATYYLGSQSGIYDEVSEAHLFEAADQVVAAVRARRAIAPVLRGSSHRVEPARAWSDRVVAPKHALGLEDLEARRSSRARGQGNLGAVAGTPVTSRSDRPRRQSAVNGGIAVNIVGPTLPDEARSTPGDPGPNLRSGGEAVAAAESETRLPGPPVIELVVGRLDEVIGLYFLDAFMPALGEVLVDLVDSDILRARCRQLLGELVVAAVEMRDSESALTLGLLHAIRSASDAAEFVA